MEKILSILSRERTIAKEGYNRWLIPPTALALHLCIGQVYATSVYKSSLVRHFETSFTHLGLVFSISIVMLGFSAAVFGRWVDSEGPRKSMLLCSILWSSGFVIGSLGIATKQLWLLYMGYGCIGGIGLGIGYISPVSTLIRWFPDRPGLATGMAIMGFGGGALVASPLSSALLTAYDKSYGYSDKSGLWSGRAVSSLFLTLGGIYFVMMNFGAWMIRVPPDGWLPQGFDPSKVKSKGMVTSANVSAGNAIKTPQFWLLWLMLFCNVTAGIGILEQAAGMIQDFFRNPDTDISSISAVTAGGFVGLLSICNMAGRFGWSTVSDIVGRKRIYMLYLGTGMLAYTLLALFGHVSKGLFVLLCGIILSFYGGGFSTMPAYLKDLFGTYQVGVINGRLLTSWSAAGIAGPLIINSFLEGEHGDHSKTFETYKPALFTMVGILGVGFIANLCVVPVNSKYHEPKTEEKERINVENESLVASNGVAENHDNTDSEPPTVPLDEEKDGEETEGIIELVVGEEKSTLGEMQVEEESDIPTRRKDRITVVLPFVWAVVAIPFGYGIISTLIRAANLFMG